MKNKLTKGLPLQGINKQSVWALLIANAVVLFGALFLGWSVSEIFWIYWAETGVIGFYNILRIAFTRGKANIKALIIFMFLLHYAGFMLGSAVFLAVVVFNPAVDMFPLDSAMSILTVVAIVTGFLIISHGVSFFRNYLQAGEYKVASAARMMFQPYIRIFVMNAVVMVAYFGLVFLLLVESFIPKEPMIVGFTVLLVVLKTGADLATHVLMHAKHRRELLSRFVRTLK